MYEYMAESRRGSSVSVILEGVSGDCRSNNVIAVISLFISSRANRWEGKYLCSGSVFPCLIVCEIFSDNVVCRVS